MFKHGTITASKEVAAYSREFGTKRGLSRRAFDFVKIVAQRSQAEGFRKPFFYRIFLVILCSFAVRCG